VARSREDCPREDSADRSPEAETQRLLGYLQEDRIWRLEEIKAAAEHALSEWFPDNPEIWRGRITVHAPAEGALLDSPSLTSSGDTYELFGTPYEDVRWIAAATAAIADHALSLRRAEQMGAIGDHAELLHKSLLAYKVERQDERKANKVVKDRGAKGGQRGAGTAKRPHTELIRRAVSALIEGQRAVTTAHVRLLLKTRWQKLAYEWGDPLSDIVDVRVSDNGPIRVEYTARWASKHRNKRFVEMGAKVLNAQIKRALKNK